MLWMITDFSRSQGLDEVFKDIENALRSGADKVSLRNNGSYSNLQILDLALKLKDRFPDKEVFFHNPDSTVIEKYDRFHFSERFFTDAINSKKSNENKVVAVSLHSGDMIDQAFNKGFDYAFYSPLYPPISKPEDKRKTVAPKAMKNLYLLGGINRMRGRLLIEKGFMNLAGISLFYGDSAAEDISELSELIKEKCL